MIDILGGRFTLGRDILQVYTPEALLLMLMSITDTGLVLRVVGGFSSSVVLLDQLYWVNLVGGSLQVSVRFIPSTTSTGLTGVMTGGLNTAQQQIQPVGNVERD